MGGARDGSVSLGVCECDCFFGRKESVSLAQGGVFFFEVFFRRGLFWEVFPGSFVFGCVVSFLGERMFF